MIYFSIGSQTISVCNQAPKVIRKFITSDEKCQLFEFLLKYLISIRKFITSDPLDLFK